MPYRLNSSAYRADSGRIIDTRGLKRKTPRVVSDALGHAGHQFRLAPVTFWIAVGSLVIMAGWSLATGTYFAFHDDVITRLIVRQADLQSAYEDRIAELRTQVDRITSRQLLDQEHIEKKIESMLRRQSTLESRSSSLMGLPDPVSTGSIRSTPLRGSHIEIAPASKLNPSPIGGTLILTAPPARDTRSESRALPSSSSVRATANSASNDFASKLARLQEALNRIEDRQTATLNAIEESYDHRVKRMRSVLADLGVDPGKAPNVPGATGGPLIPVVVAPDAASFERQLYRINMARAHADRLTRTLGAVPIRKPISGEIDLSSGFGVRIDPFVRGPAMHTGLDFRSNSGDPVRATANGTVTSATWSGGYGRMVEIDHGNGFLTRYGHLSEIIVKAGQTVRIGQMVGRVGSTGRSTGPHLHYETRIDGEAVDPQKFLRAGLRLGNAL